MSIWCSTLDFSADDHHLTCAQWEPDYCAPGFGSCAHDGHLMFVNRNDGNYDRYRRNSSVACTCLCGPLVYRNSHTVPTATGQRGGSLDVAYIPGHIGADGWPDGDDGPPVEFVRVSTTSADGAAVTVVLDGRQVAELHRQLGWLLDWRATGTPAENHGEEPS